MSLIHAPQRHTRPIYSCCQLHHVPGSYRYITGALTSAGPVASLFASNLRNLFDANLRML